MTQAVEQGVTVEVVRPEDGQRIEGGGPEEGEIVSAETQADGPTEAPKRHPLKHAWTFWFDNPNGKQKQSTWGSCIRAVYTFSTVEDFWWYVSATPFLLLCLFDFLDHISHFPYVSLC
jgi:translation initiation factor 4E